MHMRTVLQVPMSRELRGRAEKAARVEGFSSLQEVVRLLLTKLSRGQLEVRVEEPAVQLSARAEKRYARMMKDYEQGKNIYAATDVDDLMAQLHGTKVPRKIS